MHGALLVGYEGFLRREDDALEGRLARIAGLP
jgi:hypothetical protein